MNNKFFSFISPCLSAIDKGSFFTKTFNSLYALLGIINLLIPIAILVMVTKTGVFGFLPGSYLFVFILIWLVLAIMGWISFQIWWNRKQQIPQIQESTTYKTTPLVCHFIQTFGEWTGMWIGIVGGVSALILALFLGSEHESSDLMSSIGIGFLKIGWIYVILMPIFGFLIIVFTRFVAEIYTAIINIAQNTKK